MKELAHRIVEAGKGKWTGWAGPLKPKEELMLQLESEGSMKAEFLLSWKRSVFFLLISSTD